MDHDCKDIHDADSPRGHATDQSAEERSNETPSIDLGVELFRIGLQDLLTDDTKAPVPSSEEIIRFVHRREEMTREERVRFRMRLNASAAAREAYIQVLKANRP